ncbi:MAG: Fic family protein, partial [Deltaproteobacteria bacterium]|nr:Fic family protein [Deltaproteobacteria bacterium]
TVNKALSRLEQLGIVKELTAKKRNRIFSYSNYIDILSRGIQIPDR